MVSIGVEIPTARLEIFVPSDFEESYFGIKINDGRTNKKVVDFGGFTLEGG